MDRIKTGLHRRAVLAGAAAGASAAITGFPHIASAQAKVIKIGMPTILSGRVAILGTSSRAAVQLAVKQFNDAGGVNGRTIDGAALDGIWPCEKSYVSAESGRKVACGIPIFLSTSRSTTDAKRPWPARSIT